MLTAGACGSYAQRGTGIAHCPLSNFFFADAAMLARRAHEAGVNVGLGTDIAAGPSPSIWEACRAGIVASRVLASGVHPFKHGEARKTPGTAISHFEAVYHATVGGARALGIADRVGHFAEGMEFDAQLVRVSHGTGSAAPVVIWDDIDDDGDVFAKTVLVRAARRRLRHRTALTTLSLCCVAAGRGRPVRGGGVGGGPPGEGRRGGHAGRRARARRPRAQRHRRHRARGGRGLRPG